MSSRFHVFPYREQEFLRGDARRLPRPLVDVELTLGQEDTSVTSLVDTGSPRTVFPRGAGVALDLELPEPHTPGADTKTLRFLNHAWEAVAHVVTLKLPPYDLVWDAEVDFVLEEGLRFGLLGHEGFLDRWAVSFNAYHSYFVVEHVEALHQRMPVDVARIWQEEWPDYN